MAEIKNSEIMKFTVNTLIKVISKRTTHAHAFHTVEGVINQLRMKYDFLTNVIIQNMMYSETGSEVTVDSTIDTVSSIDLINCITELVGRSTQAIGEEADFFFLRELRDNFQYENEPIVKDFLLHLNTQQFQYIVERKEEIRREKTFFRIENSEVVIPALSALIYLLGKAKSESEAVEIISNCMKNYEKKFDCFTYLHITKTENDHQYTIHVEPELNALPTNQFVIALSKLIEQIGKLIEENFEQSFIDDFKIVVGDLNIAKMEKIGLDLALINRRIRYQNKKIMIKVLLTLVQTLQSRTLDGSAAEIIEESMKDLQHTHDMLTYVKKMNPHDKTNYSFYVVSEINFVESYKLGAALRDLIKSIQTNLKDKTFIKDFKKQLGNEYLSEIETLGVNLHFLELKYA